MYSISSILENKPEHPDTIIVKNKFYPNGLTEQDIYNYYIRNKNRILEQVKNRNLLFFFGNAVNEVIVKRRDPKTNDFYKLNDSNYDKIISGRTLVICETMNQYEDFGIVDIDYDDFDICKKVTIEVYDILAERFNPVDLKIRFTGKNSFHIIIYFKKKYNINQIRDMLQKFLFENFSGKYSVYGHKKISNVPFLDLSPNKLNGAYIISNSLSVLGLRCSEIKRRNVMSISKEEFMI